MALIHDLITEKERAIKSQEEGLAWLRDLDVASLIPTFGHEDLYWTISYAGFSRYGITITLSPKQPDGDTLYPATFEKFQGGYIAKTLQAFIRLGYAVTEHKEPSNPDEPETSMDIRIYAVRRKSDDGMTDYTTPSISMTFYGIVPEKALDDPKCRIEYETIDVPATTKTVAKVVCDD